MRLTLARRLTLLVGGALVVSLVVQGVLLWRMSATQGRYASLLHSEVAAELTAREAQVAFKEQVQEWKNILLRGADAQARRKYRTAFSAAGDRVVALATRAGETSTSAEARATVTRFLDAHAALTTAYLAAYAPFDSGGGVAVAAADAAVKGRDRAPTALIDSVVRHLQHDVEAAGAREERRATRDRAVSLALMVGVVLVVAWFSFGLVRDITGPVREISGRVESLRAQSITMLGDAVLALSRGSVGTSPVPTTAPLAFARRDELGEIASSIDGIVVRTQDTVRDFGAASAVLEAVLGEMQRTIAAVERGELGVTAAMPDAQGVFRKLLDGLNAAVAAVSTPLKDTTDALARVANRDLTVRMEDRYAGDYGRVVQSLNVAVAQLSDALRAVQTVMLSAADDARSLSSDAATMQSAAERQATTLESGAASLGQVATTIAQGADTLRDLRQDAESGATVASEGAAAMEQLAEALHALQAETQASVRIVRTIDEIAFQTNLLALNAAVEAARAGDAGRGFAVVADEVRALAGRSAEAAKQTAERIHAAQAKASASVDVAAGVLHQLRHAAEDVRRVRDGMLAVADATEAQRDAAHAVAATMHDLVRDATATAHSAAASATMAAHVAEAVDGAAARVGEFQLTDEASARHRLVAA